MTGFDAIPFLPITERPSFTWPNGATLAVWVCPNIEHYAYLPAPSKVRDPWPRVPHPDVLGYATKDYGNRVGFWRMAEVIDRHGIRATMALGVGAFERYPEIMEAAEARGWDAMCHGVYNTDYLWGLPEEQERAYFINCIDTYRRLTGRSFAGWFSPALSHTRSTPDLVAEYGMRYIADFGHDDQPFPLRVRKGRLISLPYSLDVNDGIVNMRGGEGAEFLRVVKDTFDVLHRDSEKAPRVLCIAVHPYWIGQPHRIEAFDEALAYVASHPDVWFATGAEIADWYYARAYDKVAARVGIGAAA